MIRLPCTSFLTAFSPIPLPPPVTTTSFPPWSTRAGRWLWRSHTWHLSVFKILWIFWSTHLFTNKIPGAHKVEWELVPEPGPKVPNHSFCKTREVKVTGSYGWLKKCHQQSRQPSGEWVVDCRWWGTSCQRLEYRCTQCSLPLALLLFPSQTVWFLECFLVGIFHHYSCVLKSRNQFLRLECRCTYCWCTDKHQYFCTVMEDSTKCHRWL